MTVETLSPPNPMQSLRERLIQDGSITPKNSESTKSESNRSVLKSTQDKVLAVLESFYSNRDLERQLSRINSFFEEYLRKTSTFGDALNKVFCNYASVLKFLNVYRFLKI